MLYREWEIKRPDIKDSKKLGKEIGAGKLLSDVLVSRGLTQKEEVLELFADDGTLSDPYLLKDMDKAARRIQKALDEEEAIVIFGDYDVDGITATALLYSCIENLGGEVYYKLPNRTDEYYGLSPAVVEQVAGLGMSLIITVDNGTSAHEAIECARKHGIDVVVTDHHLPGQNLPKAYAVVNPCREDDESPFGNFSGVGVAFMLAAALEGCDANEMLPICGDFAAVGTVADVMKLTGENRILVKKGLEVLQNTKRPGLALLIEVCGYKDKKLAAENISFGISPKLNAAGRMDDATGALKLLLAESEEEAQPLAQKLQEQNVQRQETEQAIVREIVERIQKEPEILKTRVLVVGGEGWHHGVIGIVASRLVEKYAKPAIVVSFDGEDGRGSGRSYAGFSLHGAVVQCENLLARFGGHDLAVGLSIKKENLVQFRKDINKIAAQLAPVPVVPTIKTQAILTAESFRVENVRQLERLAPFGRGNYAPKFLLENAIIKDVFPVGDGKHSRLKFMKKTQAIFAVLFGETKEKLAYKEGDVVDVILELSIFEGRNNLMISSRVQDMRPAGMKNLHAQQNAIFESFVAGGTPDAAQCELLKPSRDDVAQVYRAVRDGRVANDDLRPMFASFGEERTAKFETAIAALEELMLIKRDEKSGRYIVVKMQEKKDLKESKILIRLEG